MDPTTTLKTFEIRNYLTGKLIGTYQGIDEAAAIHSLAVAAGYRSIQSYRRIAGFGDIKIKQIA